MFVKKVFAFIVGLFCAAQLMAAYQYGDCVILNEKAGSLVVGTTANLTLTFSPQGENLGTGNKTKAGDMLQWDTLTVVATDANGVERQNTVAINGLTVDVGVVNAGETLKFLLSGPMDQGVYTFDHFWGNGWDSKTNAYNNLVFGGNYGKNGSKYSVFGFQVTGSAVPSSDTDPSGQPLPGVLAVLLCGGGVLGAWGLKKRKTA